LKGKMAESLSFFYDEKSSLIEKMFNVLMNNIPDAIYFKDINSRFIMVNKAHAKRMGLKHPSEAVGKTDLDFYPFDFAQKTYEDEQRIIKTGKPIIRKIECIRYKNGRIRWVSCIKVPIKDDQGRIVGIAGISRDVTNLKIMEEKLRRYSKHLEDLVDRRTRQLKESEEKYRRLLENIPDVIWTSTKEGERVFISENVKEIYGYSPEEIYQNGKDLWFGRIHPDDLKKVKEAYNALFEKGKPYDVEYRIRRKDGKWIWIYDRARRTYYKDGRQYADGAFTDITERKEIMERLKKAEKMAVIGSAAAMVGHDLRNPLQVMMNLLYIGKNLVGFMSPSPFKLQLDKIFRTMERQVRYMDKIVSDLQDYAKPIQPELSDTNLLNILEDLLKMINVPENIEVTIEIPKDFPSLKVDPHLMRRVFTNLIANAVQAMPKGGKLTIRAELTDKDALIHIEDSGVGIEKENLSKIFTPFFTTKAKGQGLGLAVCKKIVEAHGGRITVESAVNKGTIFTIKLPLRKEGR